jgi:hypothetical protein
MVLAEQLYYETKLAVNDLSTDLQLTKANFVFLYNKQAEKWLKEKIEIGKKNNKINDAQFWLVDKANLTQHRKTQDTVEYNLPEAYFEFVDSFSLAKNQTCSTEMYNYLIKPSNKGLLFDSVFDKPSFEWEEGLCYLTSNKLAVYYTDFELVKSYLSYYKKMDTLDLEGYTRFDGSPSHVKNVTYQKHIADEICDLVVREVHGMYRNQNGFQISNLKVQENREL